MGALQVSKESLSTCPIHSLPYEGICGEKACYSSGMICLKCQPEACSVIFKHKILTIEEFYEQFLHKLIGSIDFNKLKLLLDKANKSKNNQLKDHLKTYNSFESAIIQKKMDDFLIRMKAKISKFEERIFKEYIRINTEYQETQSRIDVNNFDIPDNFSLEQMMKFIDKNKESLREMETVVNLVKKYSDHQKLLSNQKDMETIIYTKNIYDSIPQRNSIDVNLTDIKQVCDALLENMLNELFINKEDNGIFSMKEKRFCTNPSSLVFKQDLSTKTQKNYTIDSVFAVFVAKDSNAYLASSDATTFAIEVMNLKDNSIKSLIGHSQHVYIVRHFFQKKTSTDYLISSSNERNCKVWNLTNYSCQITLYSCHSGLYLYSALLLFNNADESNYIVTSAPNEYMKIWDFSTGKMIREIGTTSDYTYFINVWYTKNETYIINANSVNVKMYGIKEKNELYKEFQTPTTSWHMSAFVETIENVDYLFESDGNGYLRMWNIETKNSYLTIHSSGNNLRGICLWNDKYIIAASSDKSFIVFDIQKKEIVTSIPGHSNVLCSVQKVIHPIYGESLVTAGIDGVVKLWVQK